jgi:hypothetical protein
MRAKPVLALASSAIFGACGTPPQPPDDPMPAARHCELALAQAQAGDCLAAGEHLAYCRGPAEAGSRTATQELCRPRPTEASEPEASTTAPPPPPRRPPTAPPPAPPLVTAPPPAGPPPITAPPPTAPSPRPTSTQPSSAVPPLHDSQAGRACDEAIAAARRGSCGVARVQLLSCHGGKEANAQATVDRHCRLEIFR